ncbi:hypothetical protein FHX77_001212 [Bifidobacterium commune]|uniref:Uncharacterized protein n=1 Tax=Bifidobacterium commune TaxID=1505727 RepID=A0A1C4H5A4_9BIFI|nr:hypothetical protein [Bifidobacterium commune]MBB2955780.1 hypothetical protein [Bifidobacterium commune]SCC80055.1 hypothetical protein GA0061077_0968 [Bifidobacterium commune]
MRKDKIQGRLGRLAEYGVAVAAAAAMLLPGVAAADGGGGSAGGSGGSGSGVGVVTWIADDDMGAPTVGNIKAQLSARAGISYAGNVAHATWKGGDRLPDGHTWRWTLDVTVHGPSTSKVGDTAHTHWKGASQTADQDSPWGEFPTWKSSPDKSWVKRDASGNLTHCQHRRYTSGVKIDSVSMISMVASVSVV